jgi:hypothetical protein
LSFRFRRRAYGSGSPGALALSVCERRQVTSGWAPSRRNCPSQLEFRLIPVRRNFRAWDCKVTPARCACQEGNTIGCIPSNDGLDARLRTRFPHKNEKDVAVVTAKPCHRVKSWCGDGVLRLRIRTFFPHSEATAGSRFLASLGMTNGLGSRFLPPVGMTRRLGMTNALLHMWLARDEVVRTGWGDLRRPRLGPSESGERGTLNRGGAGCSRIVSMFRASMCIRFRGRIFSEDLFFPLAFCLEPSSPSAMRT